MAARLPGVTVKIVPSIGLVALPAFNKFPVVIGQGDTELLVENEAVSGSATTLLDALQRESVIRIDRIGRLPGTIDFVVAPSLTLDNNPDNLPGITLLSASTQTLAGEGVLTIVRTAGPPDPTFNATWRAPEDIAAGTPVPITAGGAFQLESDDATMTLSIDVDIVALDGASGFAGSNGTRSSSVTIVEANYQLTNDNVDWSPSLILHDGKDNGSDIIAATSGIVLPNMDRTTGAGTGELKVTVTKDGGGVVTFVVATWQAPGDIAAGVSTPLVDGVPVDVPTDAAGTLNALGNPVTLAVTATFASLAWATTIPGDTTGTFPVEVKVVPSSYFATYAVPPAADAYTPTLFFDENQVRPIHGKIVRNDGGPKDQTDALLRGGMNDVVVGASLMFRNGASGVIVARLDLRGALAVDDTKPTGVELEKAYIAVVTKLEKITKAKLYLVPMDSGTLSSTSANQILFEHAVLSSLPENAQERTMIANTVRSTDPTNVMVESLVTRATAFKNERFVLPAPGEFELVGYPDLADVDLDSSVFAAALAGKFSGIEPGSQITDEILFGIRVQTEFSPKELLRLVQNGVAPAKLDAAGNTRMVFAITTDTTNAVTEDMGVQEISDYMKATLRREIFARFRNAPITAEFPIIMTSFMETLFIAFVDARKIAEFADLSATIDPQEPRKVNISGRARPTFTGQFFDVSIVFTGATL